MADKRPYCMKCSKRMQIRTVGVSVPYDDSRVQYGDLWYCDVCGAEIVIRFGEPWKDRSKKS